METVKRAAWVTVIALSLGVAAYLFINWTPSPVRREVTQTDEMISAADEGIDDFEREVKSHAVETVTRTIVIREQVQAEISALDSDGLSRLAISEIELFRGRAANSSDSYAAGVDYSY